MPVTEIRTFALADLHAHPWQVNVPDIAGREWEEFKADIESRGVQEPIRVSLRTGVPVIVDGHQRVRACRDTGYSHIIAIENVFADEGEEVKFLSSAAQFRRHLTEIQRGKIALARQSYFAAMAGEKKGGRPKKAQEENLPSNDGKFPARHTRESAAQAAADVGLSEPTLRRISHIVKSPAAPVIEQAVEAGELSISAGSQLARNAGTTINQAMIDGHLNAIQAAAIERDKDLKRAVESGEVAPQRAASMYETMKAAMEADNRARGTDLCERMEGLLTQMEDATHGDFYYKVLTSRYNAEEWDGSFAARWQQVIRRMQDVAQRAEIQARTLDAEAVG